MIINHKHPPEVDVKKFLSLIFFLFGSLSAENIDIISNFPVSYQPGYFPVKYLSARTLGFKIRGYDIKEKDFANYANNLKSNPLPYKVLVWNHCFDPNSEIFTLPKEKLIYFLWEPWDISPSYYSLFSRVYTWDDSLVDNIKFFKYYYPYLMPMRTDLPLFEDRKFCTMVASQWHPHRIQIINFFENKPQGEFEFYGFWGYPSKNYIGSIPGTHSGVEKTAILKTYRFCICFENSVQFKGYVTEKIFCCFAAGCVPVYYGATNIEEYIPKNCYVDYRDFSNDEELYQHLKNMPKDIFEEYLTNIRIFLQSEKAQLFSPENFDKTFLEAILSF